MKDILLIATLLVWAGDSLGAIVFEPYYSVSSNKSILANRGKSSEKETISQREEKGLRAGISFFKLFKVGASFGQSSLVKTSSVGNITDSYDEIDFNSEFDTSTPGKEFKAKETQNRAKVTFYFDPGFWIFIARLKAGVSARQRKVELFENDVLINTVDPGIAFSPHVGAGAGIKLGSKMFLMLEYGIDLYKFPKAIPFERDLSLSYGIKI